MASRNQAELERLQGRYDAIFEGISPPFAFVDLDAMRSNADVLAAQASPAAGSDRLEVRALDRRCSSGSSASTSAFAES